MIINPHLVTAGTSVNPETGRLDLTGADVQSTDCSGQTVEGTVCWDTDDDTLCIGTGSSCASVGSGSGDITSVGDVTSGAAFDGTQGTVLTFNNASGDQTLTYSVSADLDFNFSDDLNIRDATPHIGAIDTTAGHDDWEWDFDGSQARLVNTTDGVEILRVDQLNNLRVDDTTLYVDGTNNQVGIGTATPSTTGLEQNQQLVIASNSANGTGIELVNAGGPIGTGIFASASNGTLASPTIVSDGQQIFELYSRAYDGNSWTETPAAIFFYIDGTPGDNDMPGRIEFWTTPDNAANNRLHMTISNSGAITYMDGSTASTTHTWSLSGSDDPVLTLSDGLFTMNNDLDLEDTTPHLRWTDTTTSEDDFEAWADGNQWYLYNLTDSQQLLNWTANYTLRFRGTGTTYTWPTADGSSSQVLSTNGSGTLSWISAGADTNADKEFVWPMSALLPLEAADDSIAPVAKDASTNLDFLPVDFDQSTDECRTFTFLAPPDITAGGTVTFTVVWYSASVTTNNVIWDIRHNSGVAEGVDPDQSLTTVAAAADAVQGTAGQVTVTTWTETQTNLGWAASDFVEGVVCRDANNASDNFAADARALLFAIRIPRS